MFSMTLPKAATDRADQAGPTTPWQCQAGAFESFTQVVEKLGGTA